MRKYTNEQLNAILAENEKYLEWEEQANERGIFSPFIVEKVCEYYEAKRELAKRKA